MERKKISNWFQVAIDCPLATQERTSSYLFELGAEAVEENKNQLITYIPEENKDSFVEGLAAFFRTHSIPGVFTCKALENKDWAEEYKKFYQAQKLSRTFFLKPAWDKVTPVPEESFPIILNPGQAFGTGLHASTRLSLSLLERNLSFFPVANKVKALDLGTGTGILAIGAYLLGVRDIEAIDNDPLAVEVANENFQANQCNIHAEVATLEKSKVYDLVLSNILLETHAELAKVYENHVKKGGRLILAGVLGNQYSQLKQIFLKSGFKEEIRIFLQEWVAVSYIRV